MSTVNSDEAQRMILEYLTNNGGCQLPCWWGFTPGVTPWAAAETVFAQLGTVPEPYEGEYYVDADIPIHSVQMLHIYTVNRGVIDRIWVGGGSTKLQDNAKVVDDPEYQRAWARYLLPQILSAHGPPEEILITTIPVAAEHGPLPFYVLLFYPHNGMLVEYEGWNQRSGDILRICPQRAEVALGLWPSTSLLTLEQVTDFNFGELTADTLASFQTLTEATGLAVGDFYDMFVGGDTLACLETPDNIWPIT